MSSSSDVRTAWNTKIWTHATVTGYTTKIYAYDIAASIKSKSEAELLYYNQKINFFQYVISRQTLLGELRGAASGSRYEFSVRAEYFLEKDIGATAQNFNAVIDRLEVVDGLVLSELGKTWNSTVNFYAHISHETPKLVSLDGKEVWKGGLVYRATQHV